MNSYRFEEIEIGQSESFSVLVKEEMLEAFRGMSGDENPLHNDTEFAQEQGYPDRVAYGMLTASFLSTLAGVYLPGRYSLIREAEIKFARPVFCGDVLTVTGEVEEKEERFRFFTMKVTIRNQKGEKVLRGKMKVGFLDENG